MKSRTVKPTAIFSASEADASVSVIFSLAKNSSVNASRSANLLPTSCAGGSKLGSVGRTNGARVGGG